MDWQTFVAGRAHCCGCMKQDEWDTCPHDAREGESHLTSRTRILDEMRMPGVVRLLVDCAISDVDYANDIADAVNVPLHPIHPSRGSMQRQIETLREWLEVELADELEPVESWGVRRALDLLARAQRILPR